MLRSIVLLPWVLPGAISAVLWVWVFHPSWGVINSLLRDLHLIDRSIPWLTDPNLAFVSVVVAHVWTQIPFTVILVMAALSTLNQEIIEAAELDGATRAQRFVHIVFPHIKAIIVVLLVYNALTAFTSYDLVYAMTGGGPGTATTLLSFQIWKESFSMYDFGAGSAVAFIVVAISALLIVAITKALPSDLFADALTRRGVAARYLPRSAPLLILLFTAGPVVLAFAGSVIPDRVMFASDRGLFDEVTLENYRYIFTGELPPAYLQSGANRTMISDAARQAPRSLWNSAQIALAALAINLMLGAPAAFVYARYAFRARS